MREVARARDPGTTLGGQRRWMPVASLVLIAVVVAAAIAILAGNESKTNRPAEPPGSFSGLDPDDITTVIPKDAIPAIDAPRFEAIAEVDWLEDKEPLIAFEIKGDARAYPLQIMTWHEIVNDEVGGTPVAVTFCPLCNSAVAYQRPVIGGKPTTFGTSGKLIHSNLLMYDRATESLWPQLSGRALVGRQQGMQLVRHPARIVSWTQFKIAYPDGRVLSRNTGFTRRYGQNPYPGYDDVDEPPFLFRGEVDGRLAAVERVLGIERGGEVLAFPYVRLRREASNELAVVNAVVGDEPVVVFWTAGTRSALDGTEIASSRDVGSAVAYSRKMGSDSLKFTIAGNRIIDVGTRSTWDVFGRAQSGVLRGTRLEAIDAIDSFWFDWAAFHPDTKIWSGRDGGG